MSNASRIALLSIGKWLGLATILAAGAATLPAGAATYQTVYAPAGTGDGAGPTGGFVDVGGTLYGTTSYGGATGRWSSGGGGSMAAARPGAAL